MKEKIDLVKFWIKKAESDLINAENSINIKPESPLDTVCFHAQQCAEKYIKAFLTYNGIEFEKTHDIGDLITRATQKDITFEQIVELGEKLTPYAIEIRYPDVLTEEPTIERAKESIEI